MIFFYKVRWEVIEVEELKSTVNFFKKNLLDSSSKKSCFFVKKMVFIPFSERQGYTTVK